MKKILLAAIVMILAACGNGPASNGGIISIGPSNTEILVGLGAGDSIVAVDDESVGITGTDLPYFDIMNPNAEQIIALAPDVVFVAGLAADVGGGEPFRIISDAGINVVHVPSSDSIEGIKRDIRLIAEAIDLQDAGEGLIAEMEQSIEAVREISATIAERSTVYFEISTPPFMFSFGSGTFLHEMLEIAGAVNVFADRHGWYSVSDEILIVANPDVILTNVSYIDDPIGEIMNRPGWDVMSAVQSGRIYQINTDSSSRPSHRIVYALWEMARAVYPDYF